jgi:hypothetical protein
MVGLLCFVLVAIAFWNLSQNMKITMVNETEPPERGVGRPKKNGNHTEEKK